MEKSLDELLDDTNEPEVFDDPVDEPTGPARDEHGRFVAKGVEPEPEGVTDTVPPTDDRLPPETFKGLKEEREKRQRLERELEEIRQQLQARQNPPPPPPDMWEDTQGWQSHFGNEVVSAAVQQATFNAKLDMSEMMARQANPDFDEMKTRFLDMAKDNPSLRDTALNDPHPWNKAYTIAKNAAKMEALGAMDVASLEQKLREQIMAEMQGQPVQPRPVLPPTLANERNVGSRSGPAWNGPKPLSELLG